MSGDKKVGDGDYEVGKCKPPTEHQWKKGQSGNPSGRPRKRQPDPVDVGAILNAPVKARIHGKETEISTFEASFRQLVKKAIEGHLPSIKQFLKHCEDCAVIAPPEPDVGGGVVIAPDWRGRFLSVGLQTTYRT